MPVNASACFRAGQISAYTKTRHITFLFFYSKHLSNTHWGMQASKGLIEVDEYIQVKVPLICSNQTSGTTTCIWSACTNLQHYGLEIKGRDSSVMPHISCHLNVNVSRETKGTGSPYFSNVVSWKAKQHLVKHAEMYRSIRNSLRVSQQAHIGQSARSNLYTEIDPGWFFESKCD